jgi:hypothetical protein
MPLAPFLPVLPPPPPLLPPPKQPSQVRRHLHAFTPAALASLIHALASYPPRPGQPWDAAGFDPGQRLLFDFVTHSWQKIPEWSVGEAARVLWAFGRFR